MRSMSQMFRAYDKEEHIERIHSMLDDLETRQNPDWPKENGPAFQPSRK